VATSTKRIKRGILLALLCGLACFAVAVSLRADTCSYTYTCGASAACAQMMGGYSGTLTESGPDMNWNKCEAVRKSVIPNGSTSCTCTSGDSAAVGTAPQVAVGHNLQQNMVSLGANMMVSNIKNPYVSQFMSSFTNSFLQSVFDNQAEAQRQREIIDQQLAEQQRQQEEQRRIAEQQRIDAMFARLNRELKLEGLPFGLSLKAMNTNAGLELKGMNSPGPDSLTLKLSPATPTSYGLKGLPGIYVGGPAGSDGSKTPGQASAGNPNLVSGPGTGTTGPGIPGLPGIYLDADKPEQSAQLAQAAKNLSGQEQTLAQDTALESAQRNPNWSGPTPDPKVQAFQETVQDYDRTADAAKVAQKKWNDAQSRADADKTVLDIARSKLNTENATPAQQQAFNQMLNAAQSDEDAAEAARKVFDGANATLSINRTNAASALADLAPARGASSNLQIASGSSTRLTPNPTASSATVDLSQARSSTPMSLKLNTENDNPRPTVPVHAASVDQKPAPDPVQDLAGCLSSVAGHPITAGTSLPTPAELREHLQNAQEAIRRLVENHETQEDLREDATEQINDAVNDAKKQAFDLTVDFVMHKAITGVRSQIWESGREVEDLQKLAASEADPEKLTALRSQITEATVRHDNLKLAREVLENGKDRLEERARLRDFREWTSKPEELHQTTGQMEGVKQLVQAALAESKVKAALRYTPYVDSIVTWGSSLIDTTYDLAEEYVSATELDQYNNNSAQYLKAVSAVNRRVKVSVAQLNCYKNGPTTPAKPATQITNLQPK